MTRSRSKSDKKPGKEQSIDEVFDDMTQQFITDLEQVECGPPEFLAGIRAAARALQNRAESYAAEIRDRKG